MIAKSVHNNALNYELCHCTKQTKNWIQLLVSERVLSKRFGPYSSYVVWWGQWVCWCPVMASLSGWWSRRACPVLHPMSDAGRVTAAATSGVKWASLQSRVVGERWKVAGGNHYCALTDWCVMFSCWRIVLGRGVRNMWWWWWRWRWRMFLTRFVDVCPCETNICLLIQTCTRVAGCVAVCRKTVRTNLTLCAMLLFFCTNDSSGWGAGGGNASVVICLHLSGPVAGAVRLVLAAWAQMCRDPILTESRHVCRTADWPVFNFSHTNSVYTLSKTWGCLSSLFVDTT